MCSVLASLALIATAGACTETATFEATTTHVTPVRSLSPPDTADSLLFTARSESGQLKVNAAGDGTLVLDEVDDVTWFSDRPARDAGVTTARAALGTFGWEHNGDPISDDAPNAAVTAPELGDDTVVLELLNATVDHGRVTFETRTVSEPTALEIALSDVEVFIDDSPTTSSPHSSSGPLDLGCGVTLRLANKNLTTVLFVFATSAGVIAAAPVERSADGPANVQFGAPRATIQLDGRFHGDEVNFDVIGSTFGDPRAANCQISAYDMWAQVPVPAS